MTRVTDATQQQPDLFVKGCPSRSVLEHVTSRWGVLVLVTLLGDTKRFSELGRAVGGVSDKMLAQTLQALERDGIVHRKVHPVIPPHVDYSLTELGANVAPRVLGLFDWVEQNLIDVLDARHAYDERKTAGGP